MIIGNGLLAKAFNEYSDNDDVLIFASGVSDSTETDRNVFLRENELLRKIIDSHPTKKIIYFSTCSIYDDSVNSSDYVRHKLKMEDLIAKKCHKHIIFRLTNIVGYGGNKNTIFNYLFEKIIRDECLTIWKNATRNILDVEHAAKIVSLIISTGESNRIMNVANTQNYNIIDIVYTIEKFLNTKAKTVFINKGTSVSVDISETKRYAESVMHDAQDNYIGYLLEKYYAKEPLIYSVSASVR